MTTPHRLLPAAVLTLTSLLMSLAAVAQSRAIQSPAGQHLSPAQAQAETNKRVVLEFYEQAINRKDFAAAAKFLGPRYIQHNPTAADGVQGLEKFVAFLREKFPNAHSEVKRVLVDGDYVILHVHAIREPGTRGFAIMDIFRLENSKIVEHWDVRQEIPTEAANSNTMF